MGNNYREERKLWCSGLIMLVLFPESIIRLPYLASLMLQSHDTFSEENSLQNHAKGQTEWEQLRKRRQWSRPTAMTNLKFRGIQPRKQSEGISQNTKAGNISGTFKYNNVRHNTASTLLNKKSRPLTKITPFLLSPWRRWLPIHECICHDEGTFSF